MANRKPATKKTRFEVFKRDKFTCQYCGKSSPDVILHIDHIEPVSKGGTNDILNLITSCSDCNLGKGARKLDDSSELKKKKKELDELQERKAQMELMFEWQKELLSIDSMAVGMVDEYLKEISGYNLSDSGKRKADKWIKKYGLNLVLEKAREAFAKYYESGEESFGISFNKIPSFAEYSKKSPIDKKKSYIYGIAKNRFNYMSHKNFWAGMSWIDNEDDLDELKLAAKDLTKWSDFKQLLWEVADDYRH